MTSARYAAFLVCSLPLFGLGACRLVARPSSGPVEVPPAVEPVAEAATGATLRRMVEITLDDWHDAAAAADGERYFGHMAEGAVFIGTDATERWTRRAFRIYAEPYFSQGRGWRYVPRDRHVYVDATGTVAWADERLFNDKYGECRGTAVLERFSDGWRIVHYTLSLSIPNDAAEDVVERIRAGG